MGTPVVTRSTDASSQNKNGHRWKAGLDAGGQGRRWPGAPVGRPASMPVGMGMKVIGCSGLRGGRGGLDTNKNLDLQLQLVCTKLKLKHAI